MQKFKKAKFKNVEFFVESHEKSGGRRVVLHEYPNRDLPSSEDLGRKASSFTIEAYLIGASVDEERDALETALESEGPGILVHPYYGERFVTLKDEYKVRETVGEQRVVRFTLSFAETTETVTPSVEKDSLFGALDALDGLKDAAALDFSRLFSVFKQPAFVVESATSKLRGLTAVLQRNQGSATGFYRMTAELAFSIRQLNNAAGDLVRSPSVMAEQIRSAMDLLTAAVGATPGGARAAYAAQLALANFGASDVVIVAATPSRAQEESNRKSMNDLAQRMALASAAEQALNIPFESTEEALRVKGAILEKLDDLSLEASDDVYEAIRSAAAAIGGAIPEPAQRLPNLVSLPTYQTTTSLSLVYRAFGSVAKEEDLISRNAIRHPAFISGGRSLRVVNDG